MSSTVDRDYLLGTQDQELARLGVQHRVWRPTVLNCWKRAGITVGSRVIDVGAGPGFATVDLAEIVGPGGAVVAVERSAKFVEAAAASCRQRRLTNVRFHELDLMTDPVPARDMDAAWCRWVACFVSSPQLLVEKIAAALRPGGVAIFHEYVDYASWQLLPPRPALAEFVREVMASWRATGGEPDIAPALVGHLADAGFVIREAVPRVFCVRPRDYAWRWASTFTEVYPDRLVELGRVDAAWATRVRQEFRSAEADPRTIMITPMVLEIIAERGT
ncbi:MAG TPA: methyltransferase domain-containing protein [Gemmataceae bacterium]|nr:methyltransferase domain-containing protein [Gemmataceae bacterium]